MRFPYARWVAFIERRHRLIVAASLLVTLLSALSLARLRLDIDVLGMLPQGRPAFDDFKAFVGEFGELDELIVLMHGPPLEQLQTFADGFAERLARLDTVRSVQFRIDVQQFMDGVLGRYLYNYLPEEDYDELQRRLTPDGIDTQIAADRAMLSAPFDLSTTQNVVDDPLGVRRLAAGAFAAAYGSGAPRLSGGYLASKDGTALLLLVRPTASAFDIAFSERLMQQVREAENDARRATAGDSVRVDYTGSYAYALEDAATLKWDIARYTVLALVGVLAVFYFGYRSWRILLFIAYPLVLTTLLTFALSLAFFDELNAVSTSFAAILYGLSIDSAIYFYTRLLQERRDRDVRGAVTATLAGLGRANVAASSTTAAAFFIIGFSCLSAVRQLGLLTALGMVLTTVEFFTLYPALGFLMARSAAAQLGALETGRLARVAQSATTHALPLGVISAVLSMGLLFAARQATLDVRLTHLRPRDSQAARVQDEIAARFGEEGDGGAVLVHRSDVNGALEASEEIVRRLSAYERDGLVQSVRSVAALLPSARTQQARLARYNQLPRAAAVDEVRAALRRHGFVPERFARFFTEFARPRQEIVRFDDPVLAQLAFLIQHHVRPTGDGYSVATYVAPANGVSLRTVAERLHSDLSGVQFTMAARSLLEEELGSVLRRELVGFFILGLVGNFVILIVSFASVATALAILAPVVMVVIILFATMYAFGVALDPVNLIVTPLLFGLGVDYGVYIVARAQEHGSVPEALRSAGRAVVVTACTTITGFGFLGMSHFPALASMGRLAGFGLFLCLVSSIILLPALLALVRPGNAPFRSSLPVGEGQGEGRV